MANQRLTRHRSENSSQRALMSSIEKQINSDPLINHEVFDDSELEGKMDCIVEAIKKMDGRFIAVHNIVNNAQDGLDSRLGVALDGVRDTDETVDGLKKENFALRTEVEILKGLLFKYDKELSTLRDKVTDLTGRSMANNITISGIVGDTKNPKEENCKQKIKTFLTEDMGLAYKDKHIQKAHRLGQFKENGNRSIVVRCHPTLKSSVLQAKENLKGKKNEEGKHYYVNTQLPDQWIEEKRERKQIIQTAKKKAKDEGKEVKVEVRKGTVFLNSQPQRKFLQAPKSQDLFPDTAEQEKMDKLKIYNSSEITLDGSSFTGYAIKCSSTADVRRAYCKVRQLFPDATHIPAAYTIKNGMGYQDDREFGEGHRLLKILTDNAIQGVAVYVTRYHEGSHLGVTRHEKYKQAVMETLIKMKIIDG